MYSTITSTKNKKTVLSLPKSAVIAKNGKYYVFVVGDFKGEYEPFVVDVTPIDTQSYQINSGLEVGDEVVDNALFMLDSDAQINDLY